MAIIHLTQGKVTLVDDEDYAALARFDWYAIKKRAVWYAERSLSTGRRRVRGDPNIKMHRAILNAPQGLEVDHINKDGLDNRRSNLRLATRTENACNRGKQSNNTSGFKGVFWHNERRKWLARIVVLGKQVYLGLYTTPEEAHAAYCAAATKHHGAFASFV